MANNEQNEQAEFSSHKSDLASQDGGLKKIQGLLIFGFAIILFIVLIIYVVKAFGANDESVEAPKEEAINMAGSIKEKEFKIVEEPQQKTFDEILAQAPQTSESYTPLPIVSTPPKPRIVKGAGVTVIASSSQSLGGANGGENAGNSFGNKPQTLFEFGQNGDLTNNALTNGSQDLGGGDFVGEVFTPTAAKMSQFDQNLLLPKGTYIGCALKTKLVSMIKGGIACIVSNDVYSANGNTLLIEKGSTITGMFNSGQIDDGMNRLFVVWQEIRTPNNVIIPVFSGATDELGASGIPGWVDHHYLKRFGSAILLSMIDDSMALLANEISNRSGGNGNNYYNYGESTRDQVSNIANTALEKMINIKPTLYKNHGDLVGVYVNKDIDFSKVYKLTRKRNVNYSR